ncbi:hypothetical protein SRABI106_02228 [Rahnella aquatilis]|nr:hypothetical protein SRABI106_02228 [Rahnella aquatilis]
MPGITRQKRLAFEIKIAAHADIRQCSAFIPDRFAQRRGRQQVQRIKINAIQRQVADNLQIFPPALRRLLRQSEHQVADHGSPVTFAEFTQETDGFVTVRAAPHSLADACVKGLNTDGKAVRTGIQTGINPFIIKVKNTSFDGDFAVRRQG